MKEFTAKLIICPECKGKVTLKILSQSEEIEEAIFTCNKCSSWYPVSNGIANMLPEHLSDKKTRKEFKEKWKLNLEIKENQKLEADKQKQIDFYNEDVEHYDENLESTPFWQANDWNCIKTWLPKTEKGQLMIDMGCGTGRASFPFAKKGVNVIGYDISVGMVTRAKAKAKKLGLEKNMDFLVGDGDNPPFKKRSFDFCIVFGVLHHVPEPRTVLKSIRNMLKDDGLYFGHENNKSKVRFLFDLSMKIFKLWNEEAGNHPLISEDEIKKWGLEADLIIKPKTSVFLPPHLYNLVGHKGAKKLISYSDAFFQMIPFYKHQGGALIIEGKPRVE